MASGGSAGPPPHVETSASSTQVRARDIAFVASFARRLLCARGAATGTRWEVYILLERKLLKYQWCTWQLTIYTNCRIRVVRKHAYTCCCCIQAPRGAMDSALSCSSWGGEEGGGGLEQRALVIETENSAFHAANSIKRTHAWARIWMTRGCDRCSTEPLRHESCRVAASNAADISSIRRLECPHEQRNSHFNGG